MRKCGPQCCHGQRRSDCLEQLCMESVLLYGSETSTVIKKLEKSVNGCYTRMLWTALNVHWQQHMNNQELYGSPPQQLVKHSVRED